MLVRTLSMFSGLYASAYYEAKSRIVINPWKTILMAGDKALTYALLARNKIPHPKTMVATTIDALRRAADMLGYPLVDKPPIGSWGRLASKIGDEVFLETIAAHRQAMKCSQLRIHVVQEYVETGSTDIRCIVLGDEVIGCMKRIAKPGEWRSNVALGAKAEPYKPSPLLEDLALRVKNLFEGVLLSIDFFERNKYYLVNEVNAIPEFKGFMQATRINLPKLIAIHLKHVVKN